MTVGADAFDELQLRLAEAIHANRPGSGIDHVMVTLPSFSVSESILSHYGDRIASLEHRYLTAVLIVGRITDCRTIIVLSRLPDPAIIEYYLQLVPADKRASARSRTALIEVHDGTSRSVAAKLLDRPDLLDQIRATVGDRPALIEPWNVTENEVALALALGVPINGSNPRVRGLGFKSEGRRLIPASRRSASVGVEDVRSADDVVAAVRTIWRRARTRRASSSSTTTRARATGMSSSILARCDAAADPEAWLREQFEALPDWYRSDLERGGIVEELIAGDRFTSPSAQVDIRPGGRVVVLATHEQVLGGESGQVYLGCRFPAIRRMRPSWPATRGRSASCSRRQGRLDGSQSTSSRAADGEAGEWRVHALEINLRKGGTTHPYAAMRNVVPGRYDAETGRWLTDDGGGRYYSATDNLVDPGWLGLSPAAVIAAVADAGLQFDPETGKGVVLHMLSGLAIDGRFGLTAIGETPDEAARMHEATRAAVAALT